MTLKLGLTILALATAAIVGSGLRFAISESLNGRLPYGTLLVNVIASFALGLLSQAGEPWQTVIGIGALGAFSTWATVVNEAAQLARSGEGLAGLLHLGATMTTGILAAWLGIQVIAAT